MKLKKACVSWDWWVDGPAATDVIEAVKATRTAGLRIIMITGDFGLTADGIAHATGISQERLTRIITGYDLEI